MRHALAAPRRALTALATLGIAALMVTAGTVEAQHSASVTGQPFDWTGQLSPGAELHLVDLRGDIRVSPASGDRAVVHADLRGRGRHEPTPTLTFDVIPGGEGGGASITICARRVDSPRCSARGMHDIDDDDDNDDSESAAADFTVQLPRGVKLNATTGNGVVDVVGTGGDVRATSGNGAVRVTGSSGTVHANSGNGDVTVDGATGPVAINTGNGTVRAYTTTGPVNASTGNGSIDVRMQNLGARTDMAFSTGNGQVSIAVPSTFAADLDADTGHGSIRSDFPLQVSGRIDPSHLHAVIGSGGPRVHLTSGNGDLVLRKL